MKRIAIIGGGISGLSALHFIKKRFKDSVDVTLYEREAQAGGTIRSISVNQCLFENGPNGFLNNQPTTFELVEDLNLTSQLITANTQAKRRYIQLKGKLYRLPMGPFSFITSPLLSPWAKFRLVSGLFKKGISTDQSIYDYTLSRFGKGVTERLVDPFVSGIYAGNIKRLHMAAAFPKFFAPKKNKEKLCMYSFKEGMGQLITALSSRYEKHIKVNQEIGSLKDLNADTFILATPAYVAARLVEEENLALSNLLDKMPYAPVMVVSLQLKMKYLKKAPDGFGFLIPSTQEKDVLGVLIENHVYPNRCPQDQIILRVMLGGAHHPAIINDTPEQLLAKAIKEIDTTFGLKQMPLQHHIKTWPRGIPQYDLNYPDLRQSITKALLTTPQIKLCANYLDGVSFNDCINNAKSIAGSLSI